MDFAQGSKLSRPSWRPKLADIILLFDGRSIIVEAFKAIKVSKIADTIRRLMHFSILSRLLSSGFSGRATWLLLAASGFLGSFLSKLSRSSRLSNLHHRHTPTCKRPTPRATWLLLAVLAALAPFWLLTQGPRAGGNDGWDRGEEGEEGVG